MAESAVAEFLTHLRAAVSADNAKDTEQVVHRFDDYFGFKEPMPDAVVAAVLELTQAPQLVHSQVPAHLLNLLEFHARRLSFDQKQRIHRHVLGLRQRYTHGQSVQVVAELIDGPYLR